MKHGIQTVVNIITAKNFPIGHSRKSFIYKPNKSFQPPKIPIFPMIARDLTFIHLGNDSKMEGLVNFEKLRMMAKEVSTYCLYCEY